MAIRDVSMERNKIKDRKLGREMRKMKSKRAFLRSQSTDRKGKGVKFILGMIVLLVLAYLGYMYLL